MRFSNHLPYQVESFCVLSHTQSETAKDAAVYEQAPAAHCEERQVLVASHLHSSNPKATRRPEQLPHLSQRPKESVGSCTRTRAQQIASARIAKGFPGQADLRTLFQEQTRAHQP